MNTEKISNYNLTASIHTMTVTCAGTFEKNDLANIDERILNCVDIIGRAKLSDRTRMKVNLNKLNGDIFSYTDFRKAFEIVRKALKMQDYTITRADMRFDSYDSSHYSEYSKLNRYLISLLAVTYNTTNNYRTTDLFSDSQLSAAIKGRDFQIEHYNRAVKSQITGNCSERAQSRLEERTIAPFGGGWKIKELRKIFVTDWSRRWKRAIENINTVCMRYNNELARIYQSDIAAEPKRIKGLSDFLTKYQDMIFTKRQLVDLISRVSDIDAEKAGSNYKDRFGIELFSKKNINAATAEIRRAADEFFKKA